MYRHLFIWLVAGLAALLLVPAALAVGVHVRVEGKTRNIFGSTEPTLTVKANALDALDSASLAGEFYYHVTASSFGPYVDQVGRYVAGGSNGWVFKLNGVSPPVGADAVDAQGRGLECSGTGPPSARPVGPRRSCCRRPRSAAAIGCLRRTTHGKTKAARGARLHAGGRSVLARTGGACLGAHKGLVTATLTGAVRSNAVR